MGENRLEDIEEILNVQREAIIVGGHICHTDGREKTTEEWLQEYRIEMGRVHRDGLELQRVGKELLGRVKRLMGKEEKYKELLERVIRHEYGHSEKNPARLYADIMNCLAED